MHAHSTEAELRALMVASLAGDADAYQRLLTEVTGRLRAYFGRRLFPAGRDAGAVEDLVQDALMAVHTKRQTYDETQPFTAWMYAIARYKLIDYLRRTQASARDVDLGSIDELMSQDDQRTVDSALDLDKMLRQLSPKVREAIRYVKLDGLTVEEAAARSGRSASAIKVSVHCGMKMLARIVSQKQHQ